ncbi:MAG: DUF4921 family protein [Planctomycetota bacterium]
MPELRKDPIAHRWVIIATERAMRPNDFPAVPIPPVKGFCPFCEGNEDKTPGEILAYRPGHGAPNTKGWRVRVVPNKFPALQVEGNLDKRGIGIYDMMNGIGAHEIIIETPRHELSSTPLSVGETQDVLWAYRDRLIDLKRDRRLAYGLIFKNVGRAAGASLEHTHSQLIATPIVPIRIREEMEGSDRFHQYRGRCVFCDIISQERGGGQRVVEENPHFLAFAPFASRFPFETWIIPTMHVSHFESIQKPEVEALAEIMKSTLTRIERTLQNPAYNYIVHTAPLNTGDLETFHWHIEIIPRLSSIAGFEWGTGFYINPIPPEDAAKFLREMSPAK